MHISEGVLRPEILATGAVLSACLVGWAFKTLRYKDIPKVAVFSALFFLASLIHVPVGPTSMHLVLGGIIGAILGVQAFGAIFIGLLLQGLLFGYGGITTLGVNVFTIATPTLLGYGLFLLSFTHVKLKPFLWFLVGAVPLGFSALLLALTLALNGDAFSSAAKIILIAHLPLMAVEGIITLLALGFIAKVSPSTFQAPPR